MFGEMFSFLKRGRPDEDAPSGVSSAAAVAATDGEPLDTSALTKPVPAQPAEPAAARVSDPLLALDLKPKVVEAISTVFDPEIPVNIYELGLIYDIDVKTDGFIDIKMTLTSPMCPSAQQLPAEVQWKTKAVPGVSDAKVEIVWDPPWSSEKMSEAARLSLGML